MPPLPCRFDAGVPNDATGTVVYNAANELTSRNRATLAYDLNGNMTSDGTNTCSWNSRNQLGGISGAASASFAYDPFGRRQGKTINSTNTNFLYDGLNPVQELAGTTVTANLLTGLGTDEYFTRTDALGTSDFLTGALGSTLALADTTGTVQTSYTYQPFGGTTTQGAPNGNSYQFTGRENDGTGLYFYRARYYSPNLQRFVSEDPLGISGGGPDLYAYAADSPRTFVDAFGLSPAAGRGQCSQTKKCEGKARVLKGNPRTVGRPGGFGTPVQAGSTAVSPNQWGGKSVLGPVLGEISGVFPGTDQSFNGISDVIGSNVVPNVRDVLQTDNPGQLLLELPTGPDLGGQVPVILTVPASLPCPQGTHEVSR
ncbi:MAG TPA: RHS repeat-associated core domain-containing protein [Candidatus Acidoferrales bacterium]|nr:RHS repeat-associated core domain-containing protein [Candidatus Acidoferrales bacterium]